MTGFRPSSQSPSSTISRPSLERQVTFLDWKPENYLGWLNRLVLSLSYLKNFKLVTNL